MAHPDVSLNHLDNLWLQVSGTLCNIACTHCFNNSGPNVRTFGQMTPAAVEEAITAAVRRRVREIFLTGGEPFLHPHLPEMIERALASAPTTVLTNGLLIGDRLADRLATIEAASPYSLELRVSLDGYTEAANDAIRGRGVFRKALAAVARLSARGLLPLVTIVRTWRDGDELETLAGFTRVLRQAGCARPRIKVLPPLPLGRELQRTPGLSRDGLITDGMLEDFDRDLLMCANSRIVTDRGVWVCPLLVKEPDARLGATLDEADRPYALQHHACVSCWQHGTICGNVSGLIDGPDTTAGRVLRT